MADKMETSATKYEGLLSAQDLYLFNEGRLIRGYEHLGAHPGTHDKQEGTWFGVWAPNAKQVSVIGDFNHWDAAPAHRLHPRESSGIWEGFIPGISKGATYKYHIVSQQNGFSVDKADPFGFLHETPPRTASVVWDLEYQWSDAEWMGGRSAQNSLRAPFSI